MEFEVKAEMEYTGTKENSKGEIVEVEKTIYSLVEKKPKDSVGVPIRVRIVVEGQRDFNPSQGDCFRLVEIASQTKLEEKKITKPSIAKANP